MLSFNLIAFTVPKEPKKKFVDHLQLYRSCISRERSQNINELGDQKTFDKSDFSQ